LGTQLEVIDKTQISQLRVAEVTEIVGRRLHVQYLVGNDDNEFEGRNCSESDKPIKKTMYCMIFTLIKIFGAMKNRVSFIMLVGLKLSVIRSLHPQATILT